MIATPANLLPGKADQKTRRRNEVLSLRCRNSKAINAYFIFNYLTDPPWWNMQNIAADVNLNFHFFRLGSEHGDVVNYPHRIHLLHAFHANSLAQLREAAGAERPFLAGPICDGTLESTALGRAHRLPAKRARAHWQIHIFPLPRVCFRFLYTDVG